MDHVELAAVDPDDVGHPVALGMRHAYDPFNEQRADLEHDAKPSFRGDLPLLESASVAVLNMNDARAWIARLQAREEYEPRPGQCHVIDD